jgi:hypothetical protein
MVRLGVWRYFLSPWNMVDIISTLVSFLWAFGWSVGLMSYSVPAFLVIVQTLVTAACCCFDGILHHTGADSGTSVVCFPHHRLYIVFYAYTNSDALMNYMASEYNLHLLMQFSATWVTQPPCCLLCCIATPAQDCLHNFQLACKPRSTCTFLCHRFNVFIWIGILNILLVGVA